MVMRSSGSSIKRISISFNVGGFTHGFTQGLKNKSVHLALTAGMQVLTVHNPCTNTCYKYLILLHDNYYNYCYNSACSSMHLYTRA